MEALNTSEKIYYIKDNKVKLLNSTLASEFELEAEIPLPQKYSLLIDDEYLFYMSMPKINATGKKLTAIVKNFISTKLPGEDVTLLSFLVLGNSIIIVIISERFKEIITSHMLMFSNAIKVSTPFIELISRYSDFIYSDGDKIYEIKDNSISNKATSEDLVALNSEQFIEDMDGLLNNIRFPFVRKKSRLHNFPMLLPAAALLALYLIFVIGNIVSVSKYKKIEAEYSTMLNTIYTEAGVAGTVDPYGILLSKAGRKNNKFEGDRLIKILDEISTVPKEDITLESFSYRDKSFRINGIAKDFTVLEKFEKEMETKTKEEVTITDSKTSQDGVVFSLRYEK